MKKKELIKMLAEQNTSLISDYVEEETGEYKEIDFYSLSEDEIEKLANKYFNKLRIDIDKAYKLACELEYTFARCSVVNDDLCREYSEAIGSDGNRDAVDIDFSELKKMW